ncbi:stage II sporulation protein M [Fodinibius halophilus]|uniref:Stage II sporulation protein M n=1 Tax=Fodinibius halophilus TaxID=1736908 RepID=A0A6M1T6M1_9BACT|nr:stage II sporulation protein M [Fodinibius halophilus]NGP88273.1 stage II sporulation protein M [Fodinibius halophilus]
MREVKFLRTNAPHWKKFEQLLEQPEKADADELADLYTRLTDDLAWAQTYYPNSETTAYLNELTAKVHEQIYENKKEDKSRILHFWKQELPQLYYKHRQMLTVAFTVFVIALGIGIISELNDPDFSRMILGDQYVNMTIHNIEQNDPMAVYKQEHSMDMFLGITFNNIRVSFMAFITGILASVGTGLLLMYNGIFIGAFLGMFSKYGLVSESLLVVFIHGTLELSAIIIAGAAGLVMGSGILFPGSYKRSTSFKRSAREGLKMTIGLAPIFILAGFLESFVTRYTEMPLLLSLFIIIASLFFVLWYFVFYPRHLQQ